MIRRKTRNNPPATDCIYRIVVLGSGGVGKSCITVRYVMDRFMEVYDPTIEDSYLIHKEIDGRARTIDIMDTAGQQSYKALRDSYLKNGQGFVLVYAIDRSLTFESIDATVRDLYKQKEDAEAIPMVVVGNKADLEHARQVDEGMVGRWMGEMRDHHVRMRGGSAVLSHLEASAKTGHQVDRIFETIVKEMDGSLERFKTRSVDEDKRKKLCTLF